MISVHQTIINMNITARRLAARLYEVGACVCVRVYGCMYGRMGYGACVYECMSVWVHVCMSVWVHVYGF